MPEGTRLPGPLMDFHCKGNRFDCQCPRVQIALGSAPFLHGLHRFGSLRTGMDKRPSLYKGNANARIRISERSGGHLAARGKEKSGAPRPPGKFADFLSPRIRSPATPCTSRGRAGQKSIRSPMTWASPLIFGNKRICGIKRS